MYWIYYTTPKFINLLSLHNVARNYTNAVCQFGAELLVYFNSIFTKMGSMAHITIWHVKWPLCPNRGLDLTTTVKRPRANIRAIREGAIYSAKEQRVYSHVHLHQTDYISRIKVRKYRLRFGGSIYKMYTFRINPCLNNAYRIFLCWPKVSIRAVDGAHSVGYICVCQVRTSYFLASPSPASRLVWNAFRLCNSNNTGKILQIIVIFKSPINESVIGKLDSCWT